MPPLAQWKRRQFAAGYAPPGGRAGASPPLQTHWLLFLEYRVIVNVAAAVHTDHVYILYDTYHIMPYHLETT